MFVVLAPEKVAGENVGVAADVWGIGVLAFILYVYIISIILKYICVVSCECRISAILTFHEVPYDIAVFYPAAFGLITPRMYM